MDDWVEGDAAEQLRRAVAETQGRDGMSAFVNRP